MAVTSQQVRTPGVAGNGVATSFSVPWMFHYEDALLVIKRLISTAGETVQALGADYTVTGVDSPTGGSVVFAVAPSSLYEVHIIHDPDLLQRVVLVSGAAIPVVSLERQVDDMVHQNQRTRDLVERTLFLADSDTDGSGAFDARGNRIKNLEDPVDGQDAATKAYVATQTIVSLVPGPGTLTNAMWNPSDLLALTNGKGLTAAEMAVETDPYPGAVLSPSANLREVFERLQYQILSILNWLDAGARTHAYDDVAASNLPAVVAAQIAAALSGAASGQNVLANGSLLVAQREPSESATGTIAVGSEAFVCDRWAIQPLGAGTITWNRTTAAGKRNSTSKSYIGLEVVGAAGITGVRFVTRLSGRQCRALGFGTGTAKNYTFGCKVRHSGTANSITPTFTVRSTSLDTDTLSGKFASAAKTVRDGPTNLTAMTTTQEQAFTRVVDFGSMTDAANGVELAVDLGILGAATTKCTISDLWLAVADISSTLLVDDFYDHLEKCKRHYQKTFDYTQRPQQNTSLNAALVCTGGLEDVAFQWDHAPPLMRFGASTQLTTYDVQAADAKATNGADYVTPAVSAPRMNRTNIGFTPTGTKDADWYIHAAVDAEWYD